MAVVEGTELLDAEGGERWSSCQSSGSIGNSGTTYRPILRQVQGVWDEEDGYSWWGGRGRHFRGGREGWPGKRHIDRDIHIETGTDTQEDTDTYRARKTDQYTHTHSHREGEGNWKVDADLT